MKLPLIVGDGLSPVNKPNRLAGKFLADLLVEGRRLHGREREVHAALGQRANHFLGRDVSDHLILRKRAAAEAAERGVETAAAGVEGGLHFRLRVRPRAVEVNSDLRVASSVDHCSHDFLDQIRLGDADCIREGN